MKTILIKATLTTVICALFSIGSTVMAANRTWTGTAADSNWSDGGNWGGTAPGPGDAVIFNDSTNVNMNNDILPQPLTGITFDATTNSSYAVTNNTIYLNGNIADDSSLSQYINVSLLMTNGSKTISILPGGELYIGGVIGNYPLAGQNNAITVSQSIVAPNQFPAFTNINYVLPATLYLNSASANTYTNSTTLNNGTALVLDFSNMSTPVNLISTNAITLNGATYTLKGNPTTASFQTNLFLTLGTGSSSIVLNNNGGPGMTLAIPATFTRNAPGTLNLDISGGGSLAAVPGTVNGVYGFATVYDGTGIGFATSNLTTRTMVRYTGATPLLSALTTASLITNYITSGSLTMAASSFGLNSLTLDATAGNGVLDLGGPTDVMTNNSRGILMIGANNFTIQNGMIATNNGEIIIHQMGTGTLNLNATIGTGSAAVTKNGPGTMVINSLSTNSGTFSIDQGKVVLGVASTAGAGPLGNTTNTVALNAGAILDLNGNNLTVGAFSGGNNGVGMVTNSVSGPPAVIALGNGNSRISAYSSTLFAGNLTLKIIGDNGTADNFANLANTFTGGLTYSGNQLNDRIVNPMSVGYGSVTLAGSGGFTIPSSGITGWNTPGMSNAIVINGTGNQINFQNNTAGNLALFYGPWTGSGTVTFNCSFSPSMVFGGDISGFGGTFVLQGSANNGTCTYGISNNINGTSIGGSSRAIFDMQVNGASTGNTFLQLAGTNALFSTINLGDVNTTGNAGNPAQLFLRNNTANTTNTFVVGGANASSTFAGVVEDGANGNSVVAITKVGTGTWTLTGGELWSGPTTISNGVLAVDGSLGAGWLGYSPVTVYGPGGLGGDGSINGPVTLLSGNAGLILTNSAIGTLNLTGGLTLNDGNVLGFDVGSPADQINVNNSTFAQSGTATIYLQQTAGFAAGTYNLIVNAPGISAANFILGNTIPGYNASLTVPTSGTLSLVVSSVAPTNAFWDNRSGTAWNVVNNWDTTVSGGSPLTSLPTTPTDIYFAANGANNFNTTLGQNFSIHSLTFITANNTTIDGPNVLTISAGVTNSSSAGSNNINTAVSIGTPQTWANNGAYSLLVNSNISGSAALTFNGGSSGIILNSSNSYSGGTYIAGGTLSLGNINAALPGGQPVAVVGSGSTLAIGNATNTIGALSVTNGSVLGGAGVLRGSSYLASGNDIFGANLGGSGTFSVYDGGTVVVSGTNTYAGATAVNNGTLQLGSSSALGTSSSLTVGASGTLNLDGYNVTVPVSTVSGAIENSGTSAAITKDWANGNNSFAINGSGNITFPAMSGTAAWTVTQNSTGTNVYGGTNDNSFMVLVVNNGTAILSKSNSVTSHVVGGSGTGTADLILNGGLVQIAPNGNGDQLFNNRLITLNGGEFDMNGQSEAVDGINGGAGFVTNSNPGSLSTFTLGANGAVSVGTYAGLIAGNLSVVKEGAGAQALAGVNTYTGGTIVSNGVLLLTEPGSISDSSPIVVAPGAVLDVSGRLDQTLTLNSGQVLMGSGTINGSVTNQPGSTIDPGGTNAIGTLTITNNVTLNGSLVMELNITNGLQTNDELVAGGTIAGGGVLSVTNIGPTLAVGDTFQLFSSAVTGFSSTQLASTDANGATYTWSNMVAVNGTIKVLTVVPGINSNPTNIVYGITNGNLTLSWPVDHKGWTLQAQTNALTTGLNNNWVNVPGSTATNLVVVPIVTTNPSVFYRLYFSH